MDHPLLQEIAAQYPLDKKNNNNKTTKSHHKTVAQILGRWCIQHGFCHTPKSVNSNRMLENADILDFELSQEHMKQLDTQLTTLENIHTFVELYRKCVNRDTSKDGTMEGVKMTITED